MRFQPHHKKIGIISILVFVCVTMPMYFAHAGVGCIISASPISGCISDVFSGMLQSIFLGIEGLTKLIAPMLSLAVNVRAGGSIPVVTATWTILRDFSNMFFIVILIFMAFSTIFNYGNYTFQKMIGRLIIVAVLINFSLVIGNLVIDFCQVLTNVFLGSIGNLGDRLGQVLNPTLLFPTNLGNIVDFTGAGVGSMIFAIILAAIFLFSMIIATTFAVIRIPFIWGLLIVSPFAWMAYILPSSQHRWKEWWKNFIGWNLFLPVYLFFMYLGLYFLSQQSVIINAVLKANATGNNPSGFFGLTNTATFNLLFFYIFAAFVMAGGTWAATRVVTAVGGTGFDKGVHWAKEFGHNIYGYTQVRPAIQAAKDRRDQLLKEGLPGPLGKVWRGQRGYQGDVAKWDDRFRVGERNAVEKQLATDISGYKGKMRNKNNQELLESIGSGSIAKQLATRELLRERKQLTNEELLNTYRMYGSDRTENGRKFAMDIDYAKLTKDNRNLWYGIVNDTQVRQKIAEAIVEKGDIKDDAAGLAKSLALAELYRSEADKIEFVDKVKKKNLKLGLKTLRDLVDQNGVSLLKTKIKDPVTGAEIEVVGQAAFGESFKQAVSKMKPADLLEIPVETLNTDTEMRDLVKASLNAQKVQYILQNATQAQMDGAWTSLTKDITEKVEAEKSKETDKLKNAFVEAIKETSKKNPVEPGRGTGQYKQPPGFNSKAIGTGYEISDKINHANVIDLRNQPKVNIE